MWRPLGRPSVAAAAAAAALSGLLASAARVLFAQASVEQVPAAETAPPLPVATPSVETVVEKWPERARQIARVMIEKYGPPGKVAEDSLIWYGNGVWRRTVVYGTAWPHYIALPDKDYLEQTVACRVPDEKIDALKRFDPRVVIDREGRKLSARSESEPLNFLVLNLAHEIIAGRRSVEDARDFYRRTEELAAAGKSSRYLQGLMFAPDDGRGSVSPASR